MAVDLRFWPSILSSLIMSPRKKHAPKDYSADQTKGAIICNLEKYAYLTASRPSSSTSNRSSQPRPRVGKIDAGSSAAKKIQIELCSIKSGQKSQCAMFSWRELIEWRKLASRTCTLGASNIADFNRRQPFCVCASLEVESRELFPHARGCSPKRSSENGPRQRKLVGGAGQ